MMRSQVCHCFVVDGKVPSPYKCEIKRFGTRLNEETVDDYCHWSECDHLTNRKTRTVTVSLIYSLSSQKLANSAVTIRTAL